MGKKAKRETQAAPIAAELEHQEQVAAGAPIDAAMAQAVSAPREDGPGGLRDRVAELEHELAEMRGLAEQAVEAARVATERRNAEFEHRALADMLLGLEHRATAHADVATLRAMADAAAMARALEVANDPARARAARRISDRLTVPNLKANGAVHHA